LILFILYQTFIENSGDPLSLLDIPYPLYNDIILKQIGEKKREKKLYDQKMQNINTKASKKAPIRRR